MRIAELFRSLQGEGFLTGTSSVFVRFSGCNLSCRYCDTPFASKQPEGEDISLERVIEQICERNCRNVVITGGEPMLFADIVPLCDALNRLDYHITIETAATVDRPVQCDLMSISPKLANSTPTAADSSSAPKSCKSFGLSGFARRHELTRHAPQVVHRLLRDYQYQMKFVVDNIEDCHDVEVYLREFPEVDRRRVMLMPQGTEQKVLEEKARWLLPYCHEHGLVFCPRRQIEWFGGARGT